MPRTSDCATRSTTGHVSPPSAIPSVVPDILQCANVATRTVVLSVVSRIDCLPWHASFCSDRRCLIRTLADLPHNGGHYSKRAKTSRGQGEVSLFGLSARFSVPACEIDTAPRTAAVKTVRKANRQARSGLDGRAHGARLDQVWEHLRPYGGLC